MFLGHFGAGFGGKAAAPKTSLGTLFLASELVDLLWPTFLLLGIEHVAISPGITRVTPLDFTDYPYSHSLLMTLMWAVLFAAAYAALRRSARGAWVCAALVVSHWLLDLVVHRPDLPLAPNSQLVFGFGLWGSLSLTLIVELGVFAIGLALYCRTTTATDRVGSIGLWSLVAFLVAIYLGSLFGQPPPSVSAIAWVGQAQWIVIVWGYWIDRHRKLAGREDS